MNTSRICFNELANYNAGNLVYKWFDLDGFCSADEFNEAFQEWLASCRHPHGGECEEWNIADFENIPEQFVGSYSFNSEAFFKYNELTEDEKLALEYLTSICGYSFADSLDKIEDIHIVEQDIEDYAFDYINETEELPEIAKQYFDYSAYARDMEINGLVYNWSEKGVLVINYCCH